MGKTCKESQQSEGNCFGAQSRHSCPGKVQPVSQCPTLLDGWSRAKPRCVSGPWEMVLPPQKLTLGDESVLAGQQQEV